MYEKIMVPLDGSVLAEAALPYAEELATPLGSEITLLLVGEEEEQSYLQNIAEFVREEAAQYSLQTGTPQSKVNPVILSGHPAEEIVDYAEAEKIGLIVMSSHGRSGLRRWALGSVADKVMRAARQPVVLIRASTAVSGLTKKRLLKRVVVPLDGSKEAESVLPYIADLASRLKLEVILLQVLARGYQSLYYYLPLTTAQVESDQARASAYLAEVAAGLKTRGISVMTEERLSIEIRFGNPAEEIMQVAAEKQAGFIAMTTHGRSGIRRGIFGSVAERILLEGETPLMLVRSSLAALDAAAAGT